MDMMFKRNRPDTVPFIFVLSFHFGILNKRIGEIYRKRRNDMKKSWLVVTFVILFSGLLAARSYQAVTKAPEDLQTKIENMEPKYRSLDYMSTEELTVEMEKVK
jgi:hypothetical protein